MAHPRPGLGQQLPMSRLRDPRRKFATLEPLLIRKAPQHLRPAASSACEIIGEICVGAMLLSVFITCFFIPPLVALNLPDTRFSKVVIWIVSGLVSVVGPRW